MEIELQHISKRFGNELLFDDISLHFSSPSSTALLGINGSGKSTLLQMMATFMMPSKGNVVYKKDGVLIQPEDVFHYISICAPYLEVIEEMTLLEFLTYHFSFKKAILPIQLIIEKIGLEKSSHKLIDKFSSGMKQRVKLAQAIFANTPVVFLDEPCTNLDEEGIQLYYSLIETYCRERILIIASNDKTEYKVCETSLEVERL